jgi:hypothetical protein
VSGGERGGTSEFQFFISMFLVSKFWKSCDFYLV